MAGALSMSHGLPFAQLRVWELWGQAGPSLRDSVATNEGQEDSRPKITTATGTQTVRKQKPRDFFVWDPSWAAPAQSVVVLGHHDKRLDHNLWKPDICDCYIEPEAEPVKETCLYV